MSDTNNHASTSWHNVFAGHMLQLMPIQQCQSTEDNIVSTECKLMSLLIGVIRMQKIWILTCESWHEVSDVFSLGTMGTTGVSGGTRDKLQWVFPLVGVWSGTSPHRVVHQLLLSTKDQPNRFTWKRGSDCAVELNWQHCMWGSVLEKLKKWQIPEFGIRSRRELPYFGNIQIPL